MSHALSHHHARRLALQGLCCLDVQGPSAMEVVLAFLRDSRETPETIARAEQMLVNAFEARDDIDPLLSGESRHWDVSRMALVDRNILRLAIWEILAGAVSRNIAISEAIRLAKEFASVESSRFVNGVLDAAARRVQDGHSRDAENENSGDEHR